MSACAKCIRRDHHLCTGFDGGMYEHPDSMCLCTCPTCQPANHRKYFPDCDGGVREIWCGKCDAVLGEGTCEDVAGLALVHGINCPGEKGLS